MKERGDKPTERARALRSTAASAERLLWPRLRGSKIGSEKFRRQVPIGNFIVDFASLSVKLIVEVDGATHSSESERGSDSRRTKYLEQQGYFCAAFSE